MSTYGDRLAYGTDQGRWLIEEKRFARSLQAGLGGAMPTPTLAAHVSQRMHPVLTAAASQSPAGSRHGDDVPREPIRCHRSPATLADF